MDVLLRGCLRPLHTYAEDETSNIKSGIFG